MDERDLVIYEPFPQYAVKITVAWSKNVREERDAPSQLLIGAMDSRFCVLQNLGLWMEFIAEQHPEPNNHFLFKVDGLDDPLRILSVYQRVVKAAVETPSVLLMAGLVGSHSTRKLAATWGRSNGCNKVSNAFVAFANFHLLTHVCIFRMKLTKEAAGRTQGISRTSTPM